MPRARSSSTRTRTSRSGSPVAYVFSAACGGRGCSKPYDLPRRGDRVGKNPHHRLLRSSSAASAEPYLVYWKVKNTGREARERGHIAGGVVLADITRYENTEYIAATSQVYFVMDGGASPSTGSRSSSRPAWAPDTCTAPAHPGQPTPQPSPDPARSRRHVVTVVRLCEPPGQVNSVPSGPAESERTTMPSASRHDGSARGRLAASPATGEVLTAHNDGANGPINKPGCTPIRRSGCDSRRAFRTDFGLSMSDEHAVRRISMHCRNARHSASPDVSRCMSGRLRASLAYVARLSRSGGWCPVARVAPVDSLSRRKHQQLGKVRGRRRSPPWPVFGIMGALAEFERQLVRERHRGRAGRSPRRRAAARALSRRRPAVDKLDEPPVCGSSPTARARY